MLNITWGAGDREWLKKTFAFPEDPSSIPCTT